MFVLTIIIAIFVMKTVFAFRRKIKPTKLNRYHNQFFKKEFYKLVLLIFLSVVRAIQVWNVLHVKEEWVLPREVFLIIVLVHWVFQFIVFKRVLYVLTLSKQLK